MNVILWIIAGVLSASFLASGALKVAKPNERLAAAGYHWVEDFSTASVKTIGCLEILAGVGLILPAVLDTATVLVPFAALGLALLMVGAMVVHIRRRENQGIFVTLVLLALTAFVAWGRFSLEPLS